jgi:hypothetical protein
MVAPFIYTEDMIVSLTFAAHLLRPRSIPMLYSNSCGQCSGGKSYYFIHICWLYTIKDVGDAKT